MKEITGISGTCPLSLLGLGEAAAENCNTNWAVRPVCVPCQYITLLQTRALLSSFIFTTHSGYEASRLEKAAHVRSLLSELAATGQKSLEQRNVLACISITMKVVLCMSPYSIHTRTHDIEFVSHK